MLQNISELKSELKVRTLILNFLGGYDCYCQPGFHGDGCTEQIDECLSTPCFNGGRCTDGVNEYTCTCLPGEIYIIIIFYSDVMMVISGKMTCKSHLCSAT